MKARALWQLQFSEKQGDGCGDRIGLQGRFLWIGENQIASLVVGAELPTEFVLPATMRLQY